MPDAVDLDVVGMPVVPLVVVDGEDVGVLLSEDGREPGRSFLDVGRRERAGIVAARVVGHAGVAVPEERDALDAEDLARGRHLGHAPIGELLAGFEHTLDDLAELALRREHEHDAMTVACRTGHDAPGRDRLVVGVRMKGHERSPLHERRVFQNRRMEAHACSRTPALAIVLET